MSKETIRKTMEYNLLFLDLLNMKYVDKSKSFFSPCHEDCYQNKVFFKLDLEQYPNAKAFKEYIFKTNVRSILTSAQPTDKDEYYIVYDTRKPIPTDTNEKHFGCVDSFCVIWKDVPYIYDSNLIGSTLMYMHYFQHPQFKETQEKLNKFSEECLDWIKEQVRSILVKNVKGDFVTDIIDMDTYLQRRNDVDNIYDYIIHDFQQKITDIDKEDIIWVDFLGEGKVYVALD